MSSLLIVLGYIFEKSQTAILTYIMYQHPCSIVTNLSLKFGFGFLKWLSDFCGLKWLFTDVPENVVRADISAEEVSADLP